MIDKLKYFEAHCDEWMRVGEEDKESFLLNLIDYSKTNFDQIEDYCKSIIPNHESSLEIVYKALSDDSSEYGVFFLNEIKRIIQLALEEKIAYDVINILYSINMFTTFEENRKVYVQSIDFLVSKLSLEKPDDFNINVLSIIDIYMYDGFEAEFKELRDWFESIKIFERKASLRVRIEAREVLKYIDEEIVFDSFSFTDRIRMFFI